MRFSLGPDVTALAAGGWVHGVMDEEEEGIILILIMYATHTLPTCISANTYTFYLQIVTKQQLLDATQGS